MPRYPTKTHLQAWNQWETLGFSYQVPKETWTLFFAQQKKAPNHVLRFRYLNWKSSLSDRNLWSMQLRQVGPMNSTVPLIVLIASSPGFQLNNESCGDHNHVPSSWLLTTGTVDVSGNCWINGSLKSWTHLQSAFHISQLAIKKHIVIYLVVEFTHSKKICSSNWISSLRIGVRKQT